MGILPLVLLSLVAGVIAGDSNSLDIGNSNHGWDLVVTNPPRECAPLRLWYNVSNTAGAIVSFHTPEEGRDEWMTLNPPSGTGTLSWTVPLHQGKQFIVRNTDGYEQVLTVGSATGGTSCGQDASQVTGTSNYGALHSATYNRLRSTSYPSFSISRGDQFRPVEFPSGSFQDHNVLLGVAVPSTTSKSSTSDQPSTSESPNNPGSTSDPSSGENSKSLSSTTSGADASNSPTATPAVTPGRATNGFAPAVRGRRKAKSRLPQMVGGSSSNDSGSRSNTGAIVGGILAAVVVGSLIGAFCVWLHRRRRQRLREGTPVLLNSMVETAISTAGSTSGLFVPSRMDRKNRNIYTESDDDLGTLPGTSGPSRQVQRSYFGGETDYPASTAHRDADSEVAETVITNPAGNVPPPRYSQFG
ncbi:hypothetical protein BKA62DRAFT_775484 [Auriculariales sp. MPI-PUGE-AT-0066]|nr:hypothetical protein BKA62DRAFT_775484 [Auriculariales sp. MPI-PUGE-AT-0066]